MRIFTELDADLFAIEVKHETRQLLKLQESSGQTIDIDQKIKELLVTRKSLIDFTGLTPENIEGKIEEQKQSIRETLGN